MIHDDIEQDTNAALVRTVNQGTQVSFITHIRIERSPVLSVIAVISVVGEIAFGATADPTVNLLKRCADPQGVDAQLLQVVEFTGESAQIATVESANFLHAVVATSVAVVVAWVTIYKAIRQNEIHRSVMPVESCRGIGFRPFQQQQPVTGCGRL